MCYGGASGGGYCGRESGYKAVDIYAGKTRRMGISDSRI